MTRRSCSAGLGRLGRVPAARRELITNEVGQFRAVLLDPGSYDILCADGAGADEQRLLFLARQPAFTSTIADRLLAGEGRRIIHTLGECVIGSKRHSAPETAIQIDAGRVVTVDRRCEVLIDAVQLRVRSQRAGEIFRPIHQAGGTVRSHSRAIPQARSRTQALTFKQRRFLDGKLNGQSSAEAARSAGYSESVARNADRIIVGSPNFQAAVKELLREFGITDEYLAQTDP